MYLRGMAAFRKNSGGTRFRTPSGFYSGEFQKRFFLTAPCPEGTSGISCMTGNKTL